MYENPPTVLEDFLEQTSAIMRQFDDDLATLKAHPDNLECLNRMFRIAHTIKGSSAFIQFETLGHLSQHLAILLNKARHGELAVSSDFMDLIDEATQKIHLILSHIEKRGYEGHIEIDTTVEKLASYVHRRDDPSRLTDTTPSTPLMTNDPPVMINERRLSISIRDLEDLEALIAKVDHERKHLAKIYDAMKRREEDSPYLMELSQTISELSSTITNLHRCVAQIRAVSIQKLFKKFPRMVRDLSRFLKKEIKLLITGEETKCLPSILQEIDHALVHLIRNACDHGVESPQIRRAKGKATEGVIHLHAMKSNDALIIKISDDGQGLDAEVLKQEALKRGFIDQQRAEMISEEEAWELIFIPGFSTAKRVTSISGRGIGMDVVQHTVKKLHGSIIIDSKKDRGTTFTLKIPFSSKEDEHHLT